jgi:hypothetical protein
MALGDAPTPPMELLSSQPTGAHWRTPRNQLTGVGAGVTKQRAQ